MTYIFAAAFAAALVLFLWDGPGELLDRARRYAGRISEDSGRLGTRLKNSRKKEILEQELAEALSYIRNMVILGRGATMSAELLMEELADVTRRLSPVFIDMAHSFHVNDRERASKALYGALPEGCARDIGAFLAGWEDIPPAELGPTVDAYRSALRESRETRLRKRDETISDIIYFPVVADCMLVLLNFIFVAYFIEQRQAIAALF